MTVVRLLLVAAMTVVTGLFLFGSAWLFVGARQARPWGPRCNQSGGGRLLRRTDIAFLVTALAILLTLDALLLHALLAH